MPRPYLRLDRTLTLGLAQPLSHVSRNFSRCRIPVLMYHGISNDIGTSHPYFETNTSPGVFERQMQHLYDRGYRPINLDVAVRMIGSGTCPKGAVVITFDDGLRNFYAQAMPILHAHQFSATMFVVSGFPGNPSIASNDRKFMSWSEVREVESLGITIGSHTVSHPKLRDMKPSDVERELEDSKQTIEDRLGKTVSAFSYPYAFPEQDTVFRRFLRECVEKVGYDCGVTTVLGSVHETSDRYFLPRIPVNEHDDIRLFQAKLEGAYDWLHMPQLVYKFGRDYFRATNYLSKEREHKSSILTDV